MLNEDTTTMTNDDGQDARATKRAKRTTSRVIRDARPGPVSYTHLTLPTSDLV